jgi:hypothetical protein
MVAWQPREYSSPPAHILIGIVSPEFLIGIVSPEFLPEFAGIRGYDPATVHLMTYDRNGHIWIGLPPI